MKDRSSARCRWLIPFAVVGFAAAFTYAVYALWNGVLVNVVAVKTVTYWQALGLLVLAKILFSGFPSRRGRCGSHWKAKMMERHWHAMDPEQREKLREEMRQRFGDWPRPPWDEEGSKGGGRSPDPR